MSILEDVLDLLDRHNKVTFLFGDCKLIYTKAKKPLGDLVAYSITVVDAKTRTGLCTHHTYAQIEKEITQLMEEAECVIVETE